MKNYYNELNKIIILAAIANAAEEYYSANPESEAAERAFDEAYKAEFNAADSLAAELAPELGGVKIARATIYKYIAENPKAYRDENGKFMPKRSEKYREAMPELNKIAANYYTNDFNFIFEQNGVEYTLDAESIGTNIIHFQGYGKDENLYIPASTLGTFLPGVASDALEIVKKPC